MTSTSAISSKFLEDTNRFIKALTECNKTATPELLRKVNDLAEPLLKNNPPQDDHTLFLGQYHILKEISKFKPNQLDKGAKKKLNEVIKRLKPLANNHFDTFIKNPIKITPVTPPKGLPNQGGNDCFLIALHQFLRSPSLTEHLVKHLPTELKNVLLDHNVNSITLRQAITGKTPFGKACKHLSPQENSQQDPSEALLALFQSIGQPEAAKVAAAPQSPPLSVQDQIPAAPPKYANRLINSLRTAWGSIASFFSTLKQGCYNTISAISYFMNPPDEIDGADDLPDNIHPTEEPLPINCPTVVTPLYFRLKSILEFTPNENTPDELKNHDEFGGINHKTVSVEDQSILQFPLPTPNADHPYSLNDLLRTFFEQEPVDDKSLKDDKSLINGIEYTAKQTKRLALESEPQHLILAFKRTGFDQDAGHSYKITDPIQGVDLKITLPPTIFESPQESPPKEYFLKTFICHLGEGATSGHFVSYRRDGDFWYLLNDSSATEVTAEEAQKAAQTSHIVFYEKN